MHTLIQDIRYGIRSLLKNRGFTLTVVLILAIGIGANAAIFSVVDKLLVRSLPVKDPKELVFINSVSVNPYFVSNSFSYSKYEEFKKQNNVFADIAVVEQGRVELKVGDQIKRIYGEYVSGNYFEMLGLTPSLGRVFTKDEGTPQNKLSVVVISDAFWRKQFNADQGVVGKDIKLDNRLYTIVGVATQSFNGLNVDEPLDVWMPISTHPIFNQPKPELGTKRFMIVLPDFPLMARIKKGITFSQAEMGMDITARNIDKANKSKEDEIALPFGDQHIKLLSAKRGKSMLREKFSFSLKLLTAAVALVLLIACVNIAGLLIARGFSKRKEMAIRVSIGASRIQLMRQMLIESLLLSGLGGAVGLLVTPWFVPLLLKSHVTLSTAHNAFIETVNIRVLVFAVIVIILTGIISGILPALQFSRIDLLTSLKDENVYLRQKGFSARNILVIAQIAPAIVVLIGAGLCIKSLSNLFSVDTGFDTERLVIAGIQLDDKKYDEAKGIILQRQLFDRLKSLPGVDLISTGAQMPLSGSRCMGSLIRDGGQNPLPIDKMAFDCGQVGPDYYQTMGTRIVKGRGYSQQDYVSDAPVIIINEELARLLFQGEDPIGKKVKSGEGDTPNTIIGVSQNIKFHNLTDKPTPRADRLISRTLYSSFTNIVLRVKGGASDIIPAVRREMLTLDPTLETNRIYAMSREVSRAAASTQMASILISAMGGAALLLVGIGLYGVTSFAVSRRTREIGVRMALGAQKYHVLKMIIEQGMLLVIIGIVTGAIGAFFAMRFLESMLFGVGKLDFSVYAISMLILFAGGLLACWIPARRAANIDPMNAIRHDS